MKARPMPQWWMGQASLAVMATLGLVVGAGAEPLPPLAHSTLTLDTTLSSGPIAAGPAGSGTRYEIGEANGTRPGGAAGINLLQGFELFELAEQDTAHFSADPARTTENIVVRVSEGPTRIEGRLESGVQGAHLYWLSPEGVIFGPRAELNVPGSLTVSTAESLRFRDAGQVETFEARVGGAVPTLAMARPEAFGFLGEASQRIVFESSVICGSGYHICGGAQVRGDLSLYAGGVELLGGTVFLINSRDVTIAATESIEISGLEPPEDDPMERGSAIFITNGDVEQGGSIRLEADRIHLTDGAAVWIANHQGTTTSGGNIELRARSSIRLDGSDERNQPLGPLALGQGGTPNLNDLERTLQLGSADILTLGSDVDGSGNVGAISLHAPVIELLDGAEVTTYAFGSESADITLNASERLELAGRGGGPSQAGSVVQSRNPGFNGAGRAGSILVDAGDVVLRDGASLAVDTAGRGHAGAIEIEASRLALLGGSRLRSASTATTAGLAGATPGQAGLIDVSAHRVILSGASEISVFAAEGPPVPGDLAQGDPSPPGVNEGNISIVTRDFLLLEGGSKVEASVDTGLGGSIQIGSEDQPTTALVLREGSAILAQASGDGATDGSGEPPGESDGGDAPAPAARGGDISIHVSSVLACPDCAINADGPTEGTGGSVVINNPETALDSQARPAPIHYLDAASLLLAECGAEQTGAEGAGRLAVARWPGRAFSPEAPLLALAPLGSGLAGPRDKSANGDPGDPAIAYAIALNTAGETLRGGRAGRAAADFKKLERQAAENHDPAAQADALRGLGESRQAAGAYAASLEPLAQALELARASGDPAREAAALGALANAQVAQGDFDQAEQTLGQALALAQANPDDAARGLTVALLNNLGS
ncbi:MAG: filamentous hemagglutinin N-terminal domain-containing protein, partial [Myxococcota bacterium]|nr:filamentous hemagglutinin N-terminal domain-containing protein [Myxococcota bacterium]